VTLTNIYTYGGRPAKRNLTVASILAAKGHHKLVQVSVATEDEAKTCEDLDVDMLSIWDSDIHTIRANAPTRFVTAGLAMTAYITPDEILRAAICAAEAGADAIYTPRGFDIVEMLAKEGLSVQGHVGLIPRRSTQVGGLRAIGKTAQEAMHILEDCLRYENAGAFAVEVECVAAEALMAISPRTRLVTHSIGSGSGGDIIFSFMEDICGDVLHPPRHAKAYGDMLSIRKLLSKERETSLRQFSSDVRSGAFPDMEHSIKMPADELEALQEALEKHSRHIA
jgi:3-methyl-2-oxobutanoate hydroxymethyltransferase